MNTLAPVEDLSGLPSSAFAARAFPGAKFVKGFNHLLAGTLATDPNVEGDRRVVFLSSDDEGAAAPVAALAERLGFAPVNLGKLEEGASVSIFGRRQEALDAAVADLGSNARAVKGSVSDLTDLDRLYAAVRNLARTWAEDLKGTGIRVNVLSPGPTAAWRKSDTLRSGPGAPYESGPPGAPSAADSASVRLKSPATMPQLAYALSGELDTAPRSVPSQPPRGRPRA
jgi:hypothetical protein